MEKTRMLGKVEGRSRRGMTEDKMVVWHHRLNGHEFEQTLGDGDGQGSLASMESQSQTQLNNTTLLAGAGATESPV